MFRDINLPVPAGSGSKVQMATAPWSKMHGQYMAPRMDSADPRSQVDPSISTFYRMLESQGGVQFLQTRMDGQGIPVSALVTLRERMIHLIDEVSHRRMPERPALKAFNAFRKDADFPFGADTYKKLIDRATGVMEQTDLQGRQPIPRASTSSVEVETHWTAGVIGYGWSLADLKASAFLGTALPENGMKPAREASLDWHNRIVMYGVKSQGIYGFLNHRDIGTYFPTAGQGGSVLFLNMTPTEVRDRVNDWLNGIINRNNYTYFPRAIQLPAKLVTKMAQMVLSFPNMDGSGTTTTRKLLEVLFGEFKVDDTSLHYTFDGDKSKSDHPYIQELWANPFLDGKDVDGNPSVDGSSLGIAYLDDTEVAEYGVAAEFDEQPLFQESPMSWVVAAVSARSGILVLQPDAFQKIRC